LDGIERDLVREHLALLVCDGLAVDGERILRVVAETVEEAVGIGRTPGVVWVTNALMPEEALSKGSLSNKSLSMSEWKVESFSTRSPLSSTVTVVEVLETCRLIWILAGTTDRTATSWA